MWTTQLGIGKVDDKTTFVNNGLFLFYKLITYKKNLLILM